MFQPKRTKYRKQMKGRNRGLAQKGNSLDFGAFGLKATSRGQITSRQIEAARRAMTRHVKGEQKFGLESSLISQLQKNLLKLDKVKVKEMLSIGFVLLNQEEFFMRWKVLMSQLQEKL